MEIFIGNIPNKMNAFELQRMVNRALLPSGMVESIVNLIRRKDKIRRLEFDVITEVKPNHVIRYGKAIIEPDLAARNLIKKLNNLPCRGNLLKVREFGHRSYNNERRAPAKVKTVSRNLDMERRSGERRVSTTEFQ